MTERIVSINDLASIVCEEVLKTGSAKGQISVVKSGSASGCVSVERVYNFQDRTCRDTANYENSSEAREAFSDALNYFDYFVKEINDKLKISHGNANRQTCSFTIVPDSKPKNIVG